jgi:hypothetical protein
MDMLNRYLAQANQILEQKPPAERAFDAEVLRWIKRGKTTVKAIAKANEKYPDEAITLTAKMASEMERYYTYLADHEEIMQRMKNKPTL